MAAVARHVTMLGDAFAIILRCPWVSGNYHCWSETPPTGVDYIIWGQHYVETIPNCGWFGPSEITGASPRPPPPSASLRSAARS